MKRGVFYAVLAAVLLYSAAPLLWQLATSLKPDHELALIQPYISMSPTLRHYVSVFTGYPFARVMLNSAAVASAVTLLSLLIGSLCAFGLARLRVFQKSLILIFVLSVSMFPPVATVSPLFLIIRAAGLRDTLLALILSYTSFSLPLSIWVLTNFFITVPDELYHAARIDGCRPLQIYYKIMLPLSLPALFSTAILVFIFSWNEFLLALTFTSTESSRTIPVAIALFPGLHEIPWGDIAAASIVVTLPLVALVFAFQRRIVEGLSAGAVKG